MIRENDLVAIFHSIHRVMKAEKILKGEGAEVLLIPVPRQLSSDCGLALRFADSDREHVEGLLEAANLIPEELYRKDAENFEKIV